MSNTFRERSAKPSRKPIPKPIFPEASLEEKLRTAPGGPITLAKFEDVERYYRMVRLKLTIHQVLADPKARPGLKWFLKQALNFIDEITPP